MAGEKITPKLSDQEKIEVLKRAEKELYLNDLYLTCKKLLGFQDVNWPTHGPMIEALESEQKRKLIVMPRGCLKSSVGIVGYSVWRILKNPNIRIMIDSELYTNSKNFMREIKAHLESESVTRIFGSQRGMNWSEGEITVATRTSPKKEPTITAAGVGTVKVGQHYDLILYDDINSQNNSSTPEGQKKVVDHYRMNLAILDPGGEAVVIGTRYSEADLIGWILENEIAVDPKALAV